MNKSRSHKYEKRENEKHRANWQQRKDFKIYPEQQKKKELRSTKELEQIFITEEELENDRITLGKKTQTSKKRRKNRKHFI